MKLFFPSCFVCALLFLRGTSAQVDGFDADQPQPDNTDPNNVPNTDDESCICVEYYLCGPDGTIITSGDSIVDVRLNPDAPEKSAKCPGVQVCCRPPVQTNTDTPEPAVRNPTSDEFVAGLCGTSHFDEFNIDDLWVRILDDEGRTETQLGEFPWMLALLRGDATEEEDGLPQLNLFQCGASLIHPQVAMTAAHCVTGITARELKVRAGEWDTQGKNETLPHQDVGVTEIVPHPQFYRGALFNDVALLILKRPLALNLNVDRVCLPEQDAVFDGSRCVATGWGKNAFGVQGTFSTVMKKIELPIVPSDVCQESLRSTRLSKFFQLHKSFICAGGEAGKDTCQGDGGGPLMCPFPGDPSRFVQVGIVAWGIGCGENRVPAVYANVASFRNWIDQTLQNSRHLQAPDY